METSLLRFSKTPRSSTKLWTLPVCRVLEDLKYKISLQSRPLYRLHRIASNQLLFTFLETSYSVLFKMEKDNVNTFQVEDSGKVATLTTSEAQANYEDAQHHQSKVDALKENWKGVLWC